jgi:hypothetical protein
MDPGTDRRLLPDTVWPRDNERRLRYCKSAVVWGMGRLKPEYQEQLHLFYSEGLTKREIANRLHISSSAVSRSIQRGEDKLRNYAAMYMEVYDKLERELLQEDML